MNDANDTRPGARAALPTVRISVAMCTFNGEPYLRAQLDSILGQLSNVDEIVVADDGSTDRTREILLEYRRRSPQLFRLHFHGTNLGTVGNFQFALEKCRGDYIFLCDQDDVWDTQKVAVIMKRLQARRCLLVFTDGRLIGPTGTLLESSLWERWKFTPVRRLLWRWIPGAALLDLLNNNNKVTGATVAMRSTLLQHSLPIRLPKGYWHDAWFAMHAAARSGLAFDSSRLVDYRIHPQQQVGVTRNTASSNKSEVSYQAFMDGFQAQYPSRAKLTERLRAVLEFRARLGFRR